MRFSLKSAAALVAATCVAAVPAAASARDLATDPGSLAQVPSTTRPEFRWWWPTDALDEGELRDELRAMTARRLRRRRAVAVRQREALGTRRLPASGRARAAARPRGSGSRYDITLGPGWPVSSPGVEDLGTEASVQALHYGAVDLNGPTTYSGPVPDNPPPAARASGSSRRRRCASRAKTRLDPASAVDLTSRCRPMGR